MQENGTHAEARIAHYLEEGLKINVNPDMLGGIRRPCVNCAIRMFYVSKLLDKVENLVTQAAEIYNMMDAPEKRAGVSSAVLVLYEELGKAHKGKSGAPNFYHVYDCLKEDEAKAFLTGGPVGEEFAKKVEEVVSDVHKDAENGFGSIGALWSVRNAFRSLVPCLERRDKKTVLAFLIVCMEKIYTTVTLVQPGNHCTGDGGSYGLATEIGMESEDDEATADQEIVEELRKLN